MLAHNRMARPAGQGIALGLLALMLAACASFPPEPTGMPRTDPRNAFNTGRLMVVVTDQHGQPLQGARIDVDADHPDFYRNSGLLDWRGSVTFNSVPQVVRVSVNHPRAYFSAPYLVPPDRVSEMRMIVTVEEVVVPQPQPEPQPDPRGRPRRQFP